jgi:hypothetical protein
MANVTISDLPSLSTMTDSAVIPVDTGANTYQISGANLKNYFGSASLISNGTSYANIASTDGNVVISADGSEWTFGTDGRLYLSSIGSGGGAVLRGPLNESIGLSAYDDTGAGTTYTLSVAVTGQINIPTGSTGLGRIQNPDGIEILTNVGETQKLWTFGDDGNLTFPTGNLVITPDDTAGNIASIVSTDHPLLILSTGANGAVSTVWVEDYANVGTSNIAAVYANPTPESKIVRIAVGQNGSPGPNLWDFNADGNLTFPDSSVQTTAYTGAAASIPSQTILPTIQTITVEARPAGLFGGGQGGANVTVANTIPVTEYGVIITDGTVSEKYKTGSLGSIPGTVSLTFTTGLNSTQFTVFAYVTSNAGTFYSNSATGTSGICLLAGTQIALSDGSYKAIEDITYTDKMLSWDFDRGCYAETSALWIKRGETGSQYNLLTFSDDTTLRTFDQHRIFNKQVGSFTYPMTDATPIGTITVNEHGQEITLINKQVIVDNIEYYNVITDYHMNLFSDSVLTSCRFNNIYPITDMKFVKNARTLRTRDEFENIPDRFFYGLRLAEQTTDIETVEWYVNRLLLTEMLTKYEITV